MPDGPDVRALSHILGSVWGVRRPTSCLGCPFAAPLFVADGRVLCDLLGDGTATDPASPRCTPENWQERARIELDLLECDGALLAAVAHDAREESSMYNRGLAEGAAAEREACCKAVCPDCAAGVPVWQSNSWPIWRHGRQDGSRHCKADAIRRRAGEDGR